MQPAKHYDVIVVGARCAGSPTAMLLARAGLRVLVVDRARFPSDTISGHVIKPSGVAYLEQWGLLDELLATGCPPIRARHVQFGERVVDLPSPSLRSLPALAPRRVVLDALLVNAARDAGADVWEGVAVQELISERGRVVGVRIRERAGGVHDLSAEMVVGADGRNSLVARLAGAQLYANSNSVSIAYYAYWSGVRTNKIEIYFQPGRVIGLVPTHDDQTLIFVQRPTAERGQFRSDVKNHYLSTLILLAPLASRLDRARLETRIVGMAELPNFFREPYGPGWVLVGDAGHHKDPLVAKGISDAFRDSQLLTDALIAGWGDQQRLRSTLRRYQQIRDEACITVARLNTRLARLDGPIEDMVEAWEQLTEAERASERSLCNMHAARDLHEETAASLAQQQERPSRAAVSAHS